MVKLIRKCQSLHWHRNKWKMDRISILREYPFNSDAWDKFRWHREVAEVNENRQWTETRVTSHKIHQTPLNSPKGLVFLQTNVQLGFPSLLFPLILVWPSHWFWPAVTQLQSPVYHPESRQDRRVNPLTSLSALILSELLTSLFGCFNGDDSTVRPLRHSSWEKTAVGWRDTS